MLQSTLHRNHRLATSVIKPHQASTFRAFYATIRSLRRQASHQDPDEIDPPDNDFILSILRANPSSRDTKSYLASFGIRPRQSQPSSTNPSTPEPAPSIAEQLSNALAQKQQPPHIDEVKASPVIQSILEPVYRRTALVKIQGPFTDRQLESVCRGMVYLEKLGLVSVIIVENDELERGTAGERQEAHEEMMRVVSYLEEQGANARPILSPVVRLGPKPGDAAEENSQGSVQLPEAHTFPSDLTPIRSALAAGEIPVLSPVAIDSFLRCVRVDANDVIAALARGMAEVGRLDGDRSSLLETDSHPPDHVDLTPLRLMIINREGGVPSYARSGLPHLLVNLESELSHIEDTFQRRWRDTHPTALANLSLAKTCLSYMPPTSSAVMVSHRSPSSLIANLITNKPALSSSLPHALLQGNRKLTPNTPTLLRKGLDIKVLHSASEIDQSKMTKLLEESFGRNLDAEPFYSRLAKTLDFVIVAGDYAGAAIVTKEAPSGDSTHHPITYLDKFAVLPSHQGDGTVDFLWVALHDESYGLGLPNSVNPNPGGREGQGEGRDLVWRSRANNPVNKWYFERSSGHFRMGDWVLFWCDGENKLRVEEGRRGSAGLQFVEDWEQGRLGVWSDVVGKIPSAWK
ncbi:hypothetical protein JAAARDRAFT_29457 [Jaapia argillacea MUCL 33604]|uniref:Amino-acid acetyltransferase, mitochondrial n=1 Tax=Jaapia argillacea MUCL 33604 TaxID=933084 RepID=A0A067QIW6_9AGAM|nr:hypothetical protein JAAARDRAFT_29457 [Jaapia argillacea MUCL 33604]